MLVFAFAGGVDVLLLARVLQGLATGAAVGAIGAGLVDLHPGRGPVANAAGAMSGTASGALGSALLVQLLPSPTRLVYFVLLAAFLIQAVGVALIAETSARKPGALAVAAPDDRGARPGARHAWRSPPRRSSRSGRWRASTARSARR